MIYVPMFKGRQAEQKVMERKKQCFSEKMIPLIEILKEHYKKTDFEIDPVTGVEIKRLHGKHMQRVRIAPTDSDIDTLDFYREIIGESKAFIDYFRFSPDVYKEKINVSAVELSVKLNLNEDLYYEKLFELGKYENLIPVLSIKNGYFPKTQTIGALVKTLQSKSPQIAVRLDEVAKDAYLSDVASLLRKDDYIMYDLGEQNCNSKMIELTEYNQQSTAAVKLILNSPRKRKVNNGEYENRQFTNLIDNSARDIGLQYQHIEGFGDYCGLRDNLPSSARTPKGRALALLYQYSNNQFMAYVHLDSSAGFYGFSSLIPQILPDRKLLDPNNTCEVLDEIEKQYNQGKYGNWTKWIEYNAIRYISQIYENS